MLTTPNIGATVGLASAFGYNIKYPPLYIYLLHNLLTGREISDSFTLERRFLYNILVGISRN